MNVSKISNLELAKALEQAGVEKVATSVITGRCGSTFVANVAEVAGYGLGWEIFNGIALGNVDPADRAALVRVIKKGARDGILYHQTTPMRMQALSEILPVHLIEGKVSLMFRRNIFSQAISYVNARKTGFWHENVKPKETLEMTEEDELKECHKFLRQIQANEVRAREMYPDAPVFYYEDITATPVETIGAMFDFCGFDPDLKRLATALGKKGVVKKIPRDNYITQYHRLLESYTGSKELLRSRLSS